MPSRPAWVVKELADLLGFDQDTVAEAILPELEAQTHQVRLQSHLQDFLGPTPAARAFTDRYIALRFPSVPSAVAPRTFAPLKPSGQSSARGGGSAGHTPSSSSAGTAPVDLARAVGEAFGPGGRVYSKQLDAKGASGASGSSTPQTPQSQAHFRQTARPGGALSIVEARGKDAGRGKGKERERGAADKVWDLPRSREVGRLENIRDKLRVVQDGGKVGREDPPTPECFCQARVHALSPYTPQCPHCGLILCALQAAYLPCPSCHHPLYSPAQLARLVLRVSADVDAQLALEQARRDAEEQERQDRLLAQSGGGAFPTLPASGTGTPSTRTAAEGRRVLTIAKGPKGKAKITTTTYRPSPPLTPALPGPTAAPPPGDIVPRPRSPPPDRAKVEREVRKVLDWRRAEDRPWGDLKADKRGEGWAYVELPVSHWVEEESQGRRKSAKKKKAGVGENGRVVPGAQTARA